MQPNESVNDPLRWTIVLMALLGGLSLGGCDSRQQSPPPVPEVVTVNVQPVSYTHLTLPTILRV